MSEIIADLPGWPQLCASLFKRAVWLMRPRIEFGAPQQPLHARYDPQVTWWHVPVLVKPAPLTRTRVIEQATVRIVDDKKPDREGISLRWCSRDETDHGVGEQTLVAGRIYLVPVVMRTEGEGDGSAFITNENWMLDKEDKEQWPVPPNSRNDYYLEVWSGDRKWRSKYRYRVSVPQKDTSNGHFTLELFYGGLY